MASNGVTRVATPTLEPETVSTSIKDDAQLKTKLSQQDVTRTSHEELPKQPPAAAGSEQPPTPKASSQEEAEKNKEEEPGTGKSKEVDGASDVSGGGQWGSMFGRLRKMVVTPGNQQQQEPASPVGKSKVCEYYKGLCKII